MEGVKLDVEVRDLLGVLTYKTSIRLERRITFLRGDSGEGKTYLYTIISSRNKGFGNAIVSASNGYEVKALNSDDIFNSMSKLHHCIVVFDDNEQTEKSDFSNKVGKLILNNDLYLFVINRVDITKVKDLSINRGKNISDYLHYAVKSILYMRVEEDGITRVVEPFINRLPLSKVEKVDFIIGEDKYGITEFCSSHNKDRNSLKIDRTLPKGKDAVVLILKGLNYKLYNAIFVYVDLCAFGNYLADLYYIAKLAAADGCKEIIINPEYESFEYMMLKSNLFKDEDLSSYDLNSNITWEKPFERILEEKSVGVLNKPYHHGHELPYCLTVNCSDCKVKQGCKKDLKNLVGNKPEVLLRDTDFDELVRMLRDGGKLC